jgi:hypothetical protein
MALRTLFGHDVTVDSCSVFLKAHPAHHLVKLTPLDSAFKYKKDLQSIVTLRYRHSSIEHFCDRRSPTENSIPDHRTIPIAITELGVHNLAIVQISLRRPLMFVLNLLSPHLNRQRLLSSSLSRSRRAAKSDPDDIKILKSPEH